MGEGRFNLPESAGHPLAVCASGRRGYLRRRNAAGIPYAYPAGGHRRHADGRYPRGGSADPSGGGNYSYRGWDPVAGAAAGLRRYAGTQLLYFFIHAPVLGRGAENLSHCAGWIFTDGGNGGAGAGGMRYCSVKHRLFGKPQGQLDQSHWKTGNGSLPRYRHEAGPSGYSGLSGGKTHLKCAGVPGVRHSDSGTAVKAGDRRLVSVYPYAGNLPEGRSDESYGVGPQRPGIYPRTHGKGGEENDGIPAEQAKRCGIFLYQGRRHFGDSERMQPLWGGRYGSGQAAAIAPGTETYAGGHRKPWSAARRTVRFAASDGAQAVYAFFKYRFYGRHYGGAQRRGPYGRHPSAEWEGRRV